MEVVFPNVTKLENPAFCYSSTLSRQLFVLESREKVSASGRGRRDFSQPAWNQKKLNHLNDVIFWAASKKSGLTSLLENQLAP